MLPATISYLLGAQEENHLLELQNKTFQIIVPDFPSLRSLRLAVSPPASSYAFLLYEVSFESAMVPHSMSIQMFSGRREKLLDVILSGRFTKDSAYTLAPITPGAPLIILINNLRLLNNYFECTVFYLDIPDQNSWNLVMDALRRMETSARLEDIGQSIANSLSAGRSLR